MIGALQGVPVIEGGENNEREGKISGHFSGILCLL